MFQHLGLCLGYSFKRKEHPKKMLWETLLGEEGDPLEPMIGTIVPKNSWW
jgi:hypothetical protein